MEEVRASGVVGQLMFVLFANCSPNSLGSQSSGLGCGWFEVQKLIWYHQLYIHAKASTRTQRDNGNVAFQFLGNLHSS